MGRTLVDGKPIVTPGALVKVSELKQLAQVPAQEKLYSKDGQVLDDDAVVPADHAEYGVVTDWTRGA